ncbi:hypothetical protein PRBEI_2001877700 [Prionailurus iriomotensis]
MVKEDDTIMANCVRRPKPRKVDFREMSDTQAPAYIMIKIWATEWIYDVKEEQELCIFKVDNV